MAITNTPVPQAGLVDVLAGFSQNLDANRQYYDARSDKYLADMDKYAGKIHDVNTADYARKVLEDQDRNVSKFQQDYLDTLASEGQKNRDAQEASLQVLADALKKHKNGLGGTGGTKNNQNPNANQPPANGGVDKPYGWDYITGRNQYMMNPFTTMMSPYPGLGADVFKYGMYYEPQKHTDYGNNLTPSRSSSREINEGIIPHFLRTTNFEDFLDRVTYNPPVSKNINK